MVMKRLSRAQRRIDTKLLYDQYGFEKTKFDRRYQDTHNCPVCSEPKEDRNHIFTCNAPTTMKNREKSLTGLMKVLEDLNTSPTLTKMIIRSLRHVHNGTIPSAPSFGYANFGGGITIRGIIEDQADIGWTNFLCGRWSVIWKEAQKRHYLQINKRKSAYLWVIAILKKLLLMHWDM